MTAMRNSVLLGLVLAMAGMAKGQAAKPFNWHDCKPGQYVGVDRCVDPPKPDSEVMYANVSAMKPPPVFHTTPGHPFAISYYYRNIVTCDASESTKDKPWDIIGVSDCKLSEGGTLDDVVNGIVSTDRHRYEDTKTQDGRAEYWRQQYLKELRSHIADIKKEIETHNRIISSINKIQKEHAVPSAK